MKPGDLKALGGPGGSDGVGGLKSPRSASPRTVLDNTLSECPPASAVVSPRVSELSTSSSSRKPFSIESYSEDIKSLVDSVETQFQNAPVEFSNDMRSMIELQRLYESITLTQCFATDGNANLTQNDLFEISSKTMKTIADQKIRFAKLLMSVYQIGNRSDRAQKLCKNLLKDPLINPRGHIEWGAKPNEKASIYDCRAHLKQRKEDLIQWRNQTSHTFFHRLI